MDTTPPSVSNSVKLTDLNYIPENNGFISLQNAEPSLGLPTGSTLTETNSAYYFPVFGITNSYENSRKYTGDDSLVLKNKNLGINNPNPVFNVDVGGSVRATTGQVTTLSTVNIVPPAGFTSLNITYPGGVNINSNANVTGTTFVNNLTTSNLTTTSISAASATFINTTTLLFTLTGAQIIGSSVTITGNVTATNATALTAITTRTLSANSIFTNSLTANTIIVNNSLSAKNDIYASNIYGQVNINPASPLYYNESKQLTYDDNVSYTFVVYPTDPYSTDDINVTRTITGLVSADLAYVEPSTQKPYFKNIQPIFEYVKKNGLFGNILTIYIQEDIVDGEQKPNGGTTLIDNSGNYSGLSTISGNLTAAFYSTEWLGANCPTLTAAGIKGGNFVWALNPQQPLIGEYRNIYIQNVNFRTVVISGLSEIGSLVYTPSTRYFSSWKPFNMAPKNVSFRTYVCSNTALSFKTFGTKTSADWTKVKTQNFAFNRPFLIHQDATNYTALQNLALEFDSNAYDVSCVFVESGRLSFHNLTVAMYGNGMYTYGAISARNKASTIAPVGIAQIDPYYLTPSTWNTRNNDPLYSSYGGRIFPGWGLAVVGNPPGKSPTNVYYVNSPDTGLIRITDGASFNLLDYGTNRTVGRSSFLQSAIILDGTFNLPSLMYVNNNSYLRTASYLFGTNSLALSSRGVTLNNTGVNPTYNLEFNDSDISKKFDVQHIKFGSSFSTFGSYLAGLYNWTFSPAVNPTPINGTPFLSINNNANTSKYIFTSPTTVNLSGSLLEIGTLNAITNETDYGGFITNNRSIRVTTPNNLIKYDTTGFFKLNSPNPGNVEYTLNYYTSSTR